MNPADVPAWLETLLGAIVGGAGVYAAIRVDLADLKARMVAQETHAAEMRVSFRAAHERIDDLIRRPK